MRDTNFYSSNTYLHLPSKQNTKVMLVVDNAKDASLSFKLYNPFSTKGKILKKFSAFIFIYFNKIATRLFSLEKHSKSDFVKHLELKHNTTFNVSIYKATAKDKVVLQLQSNNILFGYLKYPLNTYGKKQVENEKKAIECLFEKELTPWLIDFNHYKDIPYIIISDLEGEISNHSNLEIGNLTKKLLKPSKFKLIEHPRIKNLIKDLKTLDLNNYELILKNIVSDNEQHYYEAFEHGDFTPWNIVKTKKGLVLFDFEFFVEHGIEYFDLIKYHFQIGRLLKKKKSSQLFDYINKNIDCKDIKTFVSLFLIKEIIILKQLNMPYAYYDNMLNELCE